MQARRATCSYHVIFSTVKTHTPSLTPYMTSSGPSRRLRTFSASSSRPPTLPRLPVPDLHKTLSKYLRSLVPLLQEDETRGGIPWQSALQERQRWADEFERGLGATCQERLHGKSLRRKVHRFPLPLTRIGKSSRQVLSSQLARRQHMVEKGVPRMAPPTADSFELVARILQRRPHPGTRSTRTRLFWACADNALAGQACCVAYISTSRI